MTKTRRGVVAVVCSLSVAGAMLRPAGAADGTGAQSYSGNVFSRSTLSGDWVGSRNDLAAKGVTFDASMTQVTQGVGDGGKDGSWQYGGRGDLTVHLDTQKLGLWPGGFVTAEVEGNWTDSVNSSTGGINPTLLTVPYSTSGAGAIVLPTADPEEAVLNAMVLSATGKASTNGFDNLNGAIFTAGGRVRTNFFGRTGHQLVAGLYSNKTYTSIDQRVAFELGRPGLGNTRSQTLATQGGSWAAYYNFDQFLYETDKDAGNGVGLFGRFGASAGNPSHRSTFTA